MPASVIASFRGARLALCAVTAFTAWVAVLTVPVRAVSAELPRVASINVCADQLVLSLADPEQIVTVSWLSADPEESLLAARAERYPLNYGSAEELLYFAADVVVAGAYTNAFTRALLKRLGRNVVDLEPENSVAEIERNVRLVADAVGQPARGDALIAAMRAELGRIDAAKPRRARAAIVVRPGGFTVGAGSLAHEIMTVAGLRNVAAEQGLDRWGSLSMETLLRARPDVVVLTGYRTHQPSLANAALEHPALTRAREEAVTAVVPAPYWACGLPQSLDAARPLQQAAAER
jgi:iron complex transport system substrate-binding protein